MSQPASRIVSLIIGILFGLVMEYGLWKVPSISMQSEKKVNAQCERINTGMDRSSVLGVFSEYENTFEIKDAGSVGLVYTLGGRQCVIQFDQTLRHVKEARTEGISPSFSPESK